MFAQTVITHWLSVSLNCVFLPRSFFFSSDFRGFLWCMMFPLQPIQSQSPNLWLILNHIFLLFDSKVYLHSSGRLSLTQIAFKVLSLKAISGSQSSQVVSVLAVSPWLPQQHAVLDRIRSNLHILFLLLT